MYNINKHISIYIYIPLYIYHFTYTHHHIYICIHITHVIIYPLYIVYCIHQIDMICHGSNVFPQETLRVTICSARNLRDADWLPGSKGSDPFCEVGADEFSEFSFHVFVLTLADEKDADSENK